MRVLSRIIPALLALCALASPALVRADQAERPACTADNSKPVSVTDIWTDQRLLRETCVALGGYRAGNVIFTDQRAYYRYMARTSRAPDGVIGIPYPGLPNDSGDVMRGTFYGRVHLCSDDRRAYRRSARAVRAAAERGQIVLVHLYGFCSTSTGPALRVETADEAPSNDMARLTGNDLRRSLGELQDVPRDYAYPATLAWLAAVATDGECAEGYSPRTAPPGPHAGIGAKLWRPAEDPRRKNALVQWCALAMRQSVTYLVGRSSPSAFEKGVRLDMVHCICTAADCSGEWPVALIDTGWNRTRAYFCERVKLRPRTSSEAEGERTEYSNYAWEFSDDSIADGVAGFPESPTASVRD